MIKCADYMKIDGDINNTGEIWHLYRKVWIASLVGPIQGNRHVLAVFCVNRFSQ